MKQTIQLLGTPHLKKPPHLRTFSRLSPVEFTRQRNRSPTCRRRRRTSPSRAATSEFGAWNAGFHQWGYPIAGWFIVENSTKMDNLVVPLFPDSSTWFQNYKGFNVRRFQYVAILNTSASLVELRISVAHAFPRSVQICIGFQWSPDSWHVQRWMASHRKMSVLAGEWLGQRITGGPAFMMQCTVHHSA